MADEPKLNADELEPGTLVSNDDLYRILAEQRLSKPAPKKRGRPPKAESQG